MSIQIKSSKKALNIASMLILMATVAIGCMQKGNLQSQTDESAPQRGSRSDQASIQGQDRPTETGAGVPGYLVGCSPFQIDETEVLLGCQITDNRGQRVRTDANAWSRYEVKPAADMVDSIVITRTAPIDPLLWDVNFSYRGASPSQLAAAARASTYAYTYEDDNGEHHRLETAPPPALKPETVPSIPFNQNLPLICVGGAIVDGTCYMSVEVSCDTFCGIVLTKPHSALTEKFGSGAADGQACRDLYTKIKGRPDFTFEEITTLRGQGCHENAAGTVFFDKSPTDTEAFPMLGSSRICGCQSGL